MPQLCTFGASSARGFGLTEETGPGLPDDQFNLTTLLLPGNGTNGAQNNTFLDSSTNNFTVTRNGNTTQGTFSPFSFGGGTAQANGYYSGYFDGTGDYLTAPYSASLDLTQGNFTVEAWVYRSVEGTADGIITQRPNNANSEGWAFRINAANTLQLYYTGGSTITSTATISSGVWTHIAATRSGSTAYLFINGSLVTSTSFSNGTSAANTTLTVVGAESDFSGSMSGYISNLRVIKGTALYTANFTVPTTPLTAVTNTQLLTCQSSQFIDNSTNAFAITVNGNSQPTVVNPFGMTDWSGYFDGTGDYLSVGDQSAFEFGSGNYTVEFWWFATTSADQNLIGKWDGGGSEWILQWRNAGYFRWAANGGVISDATISLSLNTWNHIAISKSGTSLRIFVNGIQRNTTATEGTISATSASLTIAAAQLNSTPFYTTGQLSNIRIVKGTAVYTSDFTVPTAPLTAISGTSLLTCQSSTFIDNSPNAFAITVNGNAYTGTLNNPFNSIVNYTTPPLQAWSNYFDGTGDYLTFPELNIPTSTSFTIEFWFYWSSAPSSYSMFVSDDNGNSSKYISYNVASAVLDVQTGGSASTGASCSFTPILNTWYHLAFVRNTNTITIYVNGVAQTMSQATQSGAFLDQGTINYIGRWAGTTPYAVNGYMSNFRAVVGTAVYTANFTVPTTPLTTTQNTRLLTCQSNRIVDNSINQFAITRNGDTSVQPFSPFIPTQAWSAASYGGSMYFDGTGDYLTMPDDTPFRPGAGNFTIEFWVNCSLVNSTTRRIYSYQPASGVADLITVGLSTGNRFVASLRDTLGGNFATITSTTTPIASQWYHIAFTRASSVTRLFVNGVLEGTNTGQTQTIISGLTAVGARADGTEDFVGYVSSFRFLRSTALYTTSFVPPVLPLTNITNTSLLLNATNAGIPDATAKNVLETVGNAQISTAQSKFGGSSMAFDGTGDYLYRSYSPLFELGTGNFTIEWWMNPDSSQNSTSAIFYFFSGVSYFITHNNLTAYPNLITVYVDNYGSGTRVLTGTTTLSSGTWYHVAITRSSGVWNLYVNGVLQGSTYTNSAEPVPSSAALYIGSGQTGYKGYLQDFRITKGYARYTANFTPPTSAFPLF